MKTYGLTKDFRMKLYAIVLEISILLYLFLDYFVLSKIDVSETWTLLARLLLSLISFSGIATIILWLINVIYIKTNKINGLYCVKIKSSYQDKTCFGTLQIKISLFKAKIVLKTGTSESMSVTIFIDNSDGDKTIITYTYLNGGNGLGKNKLSMHYGTAMLEFENKKFSKAKYYTDEYRQTYGEITNASSGKE